MTGENLLQRPAEFGEIEHRIVQLRQDDRGATQIFLGDRDPAHPAALVDIGIARNPVLVIGEIDHALAQVGAGDELVHCRQRQQLGVALGLIPDVDQRLALVMAIEKLVPRDRRDQKAERVLLPTRGGRRAADRLQSPHVPDASLRCRSRFPFVAAADPAVLAVVCGKPLSLPGSAAAPGIEFDRASSAASEQAVALAGPGRLVVSSGSRNAASTARAATASRISRGGS